MLGVWRLARVHADPDLNDGFDFLGETAGRDDGHGEVAIERGSAVGKVRRCDTGYNVAALSSGLRETSDSNAASGHTRARIDTRQARFFGKNLLDELRSERSQSQCENPHDNEEAGSTHDFLSALILALDEANLATGEATNRSKSVANSDHAVCRQMERLKSTYSSQQTETDSTHEWLPCRRPCRHREGLLRPG